MTFNTAFHDFVLTIMTEVKHITIHPEHFCILACGCHIGKIIFLCKSHHSGLFPLLIIHLQSGGMLDQYASNRGASKIDVRSHVETLHSNAVVKLCDAFIPARLHHMIHFLHHSLRRIGRQPVWCSHYRRNRIVDLRCQHDRIIHALCKKRSIFFMIACRIDIFYAKHHLPVVIGICHHQQSFLFAGSISNQILAAVHKNTKRLSPGSIRQLSENQSVIISSQ